MPKGIAKKSLYIHPLKNAKNPHNKKKYLVFIKVFKSGIVFKISSFFKTSQIPSNKINPPCPISPNITPNINGNVIIVNKPGFTSLYLGTPYSLTIV